MTALVDEHHGERYSRVPNGTCVLLRSLAEEYSIPSYTFWYPEQPHSSPTSRARESQPSHGH